MCQSDNRPLINWKPKLTITIGQLSGAFGITVSWSFMLFFILCLISFFFSLCFFLHFPCAHPEPPWQHSSPPGQPPAVPQQEGGEGGDGRQRRSREGVSYSSLSGPSLNKRVRRVQLGAVTRGEDSRKHRWTILSTCSVLLQSRQPFFDNF